MAQNQTKHLTAEEDKALTLLQTLMNATGFEIDNEHLAFDLITETLKAYSQHINKELIEERDKYKKLLDDTYQGEDVILTAQKPLIERIQQIEEKISKAVWLAVRFGASNPHYENFEDQEKIKELIQSLLTDER